MSNELDIKLIGDGGESPGYLYLKAEAKALFLAGYQPKSICEKLNIPNPETVAGWAKRDAWHEEREKILASQTRMRLNELLQSQSKNLKELSTIREKSIGAIEDQSVIPQKFSEAVNAYINSLDMERKIKIEALQASFINDVAIILREEIEDQTILIKIANRLSVLFERYQNKPLLTEDSSADS